MTVHKQFDIDHTHSLPMTQFTHTLRVYTHCGTVHTLFTSYDTVHKSFDIVHTLFTSCDSSQTV